MVYCSLYLDYAGLIMELRLQLATQLRSSVQQELQHNTHSTNDEQQFCCRLKTSWQYSSKKIALCCCRRLNHSDLLRLHQIIPLLQFVAIDLVRAHSIKSQIVYPTYVGYTIYHKINNFIYVGVQLYTYISLHRSMIFARHPDLYIAIRQISENYYKVSH